MTRDHAGVLAALASSAIGGVAGGATRFVIHATDPVTLGVFRFGTGFLILLPIALLIKSRWPKGRDWIAVAVLGIMFFFAFSVLFNFAYSYTTAARGALTLSTMPLTTMLVGATLGIERISARKTFGVLIAMGGVFLALMLGLSGAPAGAWRGELVMLGATFCMSLYNVWSRPFIARSDPLAFLGALTAGVGAVDPRFRRGHTFRHGAMACGRLSRRRRQCRSVHSLGVRARAHQPDQGRGDDYRQSCVRLDRRRTGDWRGDRAQSSRRPGGGSGRYLDCNGVYTGGHRMTFHSGPR
jgi:hypothetical protein